MMTRCLAMRWLCSAIRREGRQILDLFDDRARP